MRQHLRAILCTCGIAASAACSPGLESYADVTDLRVLGMQAEPPEILGDSAVSLDTNVTALVVDPRGGPLQFTWSLCPVQSTLGCDDFDTLIASLDANTQSALRLLRGISQSGAVQPIEATAESPAFYPIPAFNPAAASVALYGTDITPGVWEYQYQYATLLNFGLGAWPMAVLTLTSSHQDSLVAVKRVVLGIQDYNNIAGAFAQAAGVSVCSNASSPPNCLSLAKKAPNNNPNWAGISVSFNAANDAGPWTELQNPLVLNANTQIRLDPNIGAGSEETYQTLRGTLQGGALQVQTVTEMISVSWFFTEGSIENNLTQPLIQQTLQNVYTSPTTYSSQPVALWLVLRDQRGGEAWRGIVIRPGSG